MVKNYEMTRIDQIVLKMYVWELFFGFFLDISNNMLKIEGKK
jgi:hypothetical protein